VIKGHSFEWRWEKGAFKGAGFGVDFKNDGTLVWRGIAGPVLGKTDSEKQYEAKNIAENIYLVSWAEKSGYVVTIVLNFADQSCHGIVSNKNEWYPLEGKFVQKK
jgi:phenolic acid decarboxylase